MILVLVASAGLLSAQKSPASVIVTATEVGGNVIFSGSGTLNLTDLSLVETKNLSGAIDPGNGFFLVGPASVGSVDTFQSITGPGIFGIGPFASANAGSGDLIGADAPSGVVAVPHGYVSGANLTTSSTFSNATFSSLGLTMGTYVYNLPHDTFTLQIGAEGSVAVPDTGFTLLLGSMALLAIVCGHRFFRQRRVVDN